MTDLYEPAAETRVIFHRTADTAVITRLDHTRRMPPMLATAPISPIPLRSTDRHAAIEMPQTIGIWPPPRPAWDAPAAEYRPVAGPQHAQPSRSQTRAYRRAVSRRDRRARAASVTLLVVLAAAVVLLWAVTR
jgi:hypothetical protein